MIRRLSQPSAWSSIAPLACAVHCAAAPVLVLLAPALATAAEIEWSFLGATVLFGAISFPHALRGTGDARPLLLLLAGIGFWTLSLLGLLAPLPEPITTTVAALFAAAGLYWNSRLHCSTGV